MASSNDGENGTANVDKLVTDSDESASAAVSSAMKRLDPSRSGSYK